MIDQQLLTLLQYALVEPPDGGASWPSGLWTRDEVIAAFNTRMQQYLRDTQAIATRVEIPVLAGTNPVTLPADWIATLAGNWRTATWAGIRGSGTLPGMGGSVTTFNFVITSAPLAGTFSYNDPGGGGFSIVATSFVVLDVLTTPGQFNLSGLCRINGGAEVAFTLVGTLPALLSLDVPGGGYANADFLSTGSIEILLGGTSEVRSPLTPSDAFEIDLALPSWEATPDVPIVLLDGDDGTLTARLGPVPSSNGTLELLYVALPTTANGSGVTLSIPDEALDGIKYGTLADLLSKVGRGADPMRAQYCQERFELGELVTEILLGGWA